VGGFCVFLKRLCGSSAYGSDTQVGVWFSKSETVTVNDSELAVSQPSGLKTFE